MFIEKKKMKKINFVIRNASSWDDTEIISIANLSDVLNLIEEYNEPVIIRKNHYLQEYERDKERFKKKYNQSFVKKVQEWKRRKAYYEIIIYDDYVE